MAKIRWRRNLADQTTRWPTIGLALGIALAVVGLVLNVVNVIAAASGAPLSLAATTIGMLVVVSASALVVFASLALRRAAG